MNPAITQEQKAIAEQLRLRPKVPPVARISRKVLAIGAGVLSAGLFAALGWSTLERPTRAPEEPSPRASKPPGKIEGLPKDYLTRPSAPVLGPPLPGDLGRPILAAQAEGRDPVAALPSRGAQGSPVEHMADGEDPRAQARASGLFLGVANRSAASEASAERVGAQAQDERMTSPERLQSPASPYLLQAGAIIPAALITGLRSDSQGPALAQVTQDVHDSLTGRHLLIPAGSRLLGSYGETTEVGQSRLAVAWTRLILPSGRSIMLGKLPASDPQGMAGLQDEVDHHWRQVWSAAVLSTMLAVGVGTGDDESGLARAVRHGVGQGVSDVGQRAVDRSLGLRPTLTIRPGAHLRVVLKQDLVLEPYGQEILP